MSDGRTAPTSTTASGRAQTTLLTLAVALIALTVTTVGALVVVESAVVDAERQADERAVAIGISDRLVSPDGPLADRPNVLDDDAIEALGPDDLRELGVGERYAIRVRIDAEDAAAIGDPTGGTTIRRIVLLERTERVERSPSLATDGGHQTTLPLRIDRVELTIDPPAGTTVRTVRANDRVVLHDGDGLEGDYEVELAHYETVTLSFDVDGELPAGSVVLRYDSTSRTKAVLEVTVEKGSEGSP